MRHPAAALLLCLAASTPALASGGLGCTASDPALSFDVETGVSRGLGGAFFSLRGSLDVAMAGVPDDLRRIALDNALTHSWLDESDLKLQFYVERAQGDFASVDFVVEASAVEEGEYRGGYVLTVVATPPSGSEAEARSARGSVTCFVE